ncbi:MAG: CocE/NonD family hydrolase [Isosphaeraceae bacterium]
MAQGLDSIKAHYTKYEYHIPMRDGVRLFTAVYVPKETSEPHPILLTRTPYSVRPYGADQYPANLGPSPLFGSAGYIVAYQDVRGRWMSEGRFVHVRPQRPNRDDPHAIDESTDAFDTIDWLIKNVPNHNGKVGMWGISYPGFYTAAALIDAHPALKAASPQAPVTDWFVGDDFRHNGAFFLPHAFNFLSTFGRPRPEPTKNFKYEFDYGTPDGYAFYLNMGPLADVNKKYFKNEVEFWDDLISHDTYHEFWKVRDIRPHLKDIRPAVMTVGGWFDAEDLFGALETYRTIEENHPKGSNTLVMGPWLHGGWSRGEGDSLGHVPFNAKTSAFYREHIEFPFFEFHLKGKGESDRPEAWVFETGRNQWRQFDAWPPKSARPRSLYLRDEGRLAFEPPDAKDDAFDEYVSDPSRPVPFLGDVDIKMKPEYMVDDQRFASRRPDVLVYQTETLDVDVTLAGPIGADLFVSTTGTDSDWVVKLIDVYPNDYPDPTPNPTGVRMGGFQQLVRGEPMRGKFRDSLETPKPFTPETPTSVRFTIPDVYHTFRSGHRIMVQVQSTWFPLVDRNPQQFMEIAKAKASDFQKATQRVYRSAEQASRLKVQVLP